MAENGADVAAVSEKDMPTDSSHLELKDLALSLKTKLKNLSQHLKNFQKENALFTASVNSSGFNDGLTSVNELSIPQTSIPISMQEHSRGLTGLEDKIVFVLGCNNVGLNLSELMIKSGIGKLVVADEDIQKAKNLCAYLETLPSTASLESVEAENIDDYIEDLQAKLGSESLLGSTLVATCSEIENFGNPFGVPVQAFFFKSAGMSGGFRFFSSESNQDSTSEASGLSGLASPGMVSIVCGLAVQNICKFLKKSGSVATYAEYDGLANSFNFVSSDSQAASVVETKTPSRSPRIQTNEALNEPEELKLVSNPPIPPSGSNGLKSEPFKSELETPQNGPEIVQGDGDVDGFSHEISAPPVASGLPSSKEVQQDSDLQPTPTLPQSSIDALSTQSTTGGSVPPLSTQAEGMDSDFNTSNAEIYAGSPLKKEFSGSGFKDGPVEEVNWNSNPSAESTEGVVNKEMTGKQQLSPFDDGDDLEFSADEDEYQDQHNEQPQDQQVFQNEEFQGEDEYLPETINEEQQEQDYQEQNEAPQGYGEYNEGQAGFTEGEAGGEYYANDNQGYQQNEFGYAENQENYGDYNEYYDNQPQEEQEYQENQAYEGTYNNAQNQGTQQGYQENYDQNMNSFSNIDL